MTSATATPGSASRRRFSQVFVEIPPSPLHTMSRSRSNNNVEQHVHDATPGRKENAPLRISSSLSTMDSNLSSVSLKRKFVDVDPHNSLTTPERQPLKVKKTRLNDSVQSASEGGELQEDCGSVPQTKNACDEFPSGFFYCHQCRRKCGNDRKQTTHRVLIARIKAINLQVALSVKARGSVTTGTARPVLRTDTTTTRPRLKRCWRAALSE